MRLAVIASHFIQYQAPLWRALASRPGIDLRVFYLSDHGRRRGFDPEFGQAFQWDVALDTGYAWELLPGAAGVAPHSRPWQYNPHPAQLVLNSAADIYWRSDYDSPGALAFFYSCLFKKAPVLYRGETTLEHEAKNKQWLKRTLLGPVFRRNVFVLAIGTYARAYALSLGVPDGHIVSSPYNVDSNYWEAAATELLPRRRQVRQSLGLPADVPVVLFCGKVIDKKRPLDLARAMCKLAQTRTVSLLVAGSGDQLAKMKDIVRQQANLSTCFLGFVNQSKLPEVYAAADIISLPSAGSETWGLVVNEAMYFGCVPVVSHRVGCALDLVAGVGEIHPVGKVDAIAQSLSLVLDELAQRRAQVPSRIAGFSLDAAADSIVMAARMAVQHRTTR